MRIDRQRALGFLLLLSLAAAALYLILQPGFLTYYFGGPGSTPWWERAVWGNVWACVPCGILAVLYARAKLAAHRKAQHEEHVEVMQQAEAHHKEQREHNKHVWEHTAEIYEKTTGKRARQHPHAELFRKEVS